MSATDQPTHDLGRDVIDVSGRTLYLVAIVGSRMHRFEVMAGSKVVIGRSEEADVQIDTPGLSRVHAKVSLDDSLAVQDLGSRNGTRVNGITIQGWHPFRLGQPIELGDVLLVVQDRSATGSLAEEHVVQIEADGHAPQTHNLNPSKEVVSLYAVAERVAQGGLPVLITGPSGVGKEHLARFIHERSQQAGERLVVLDCASISEDRFAEELFGHHSARGPVPGLLRAADGGTLLLDSVDHLPLELQSRLSRTLETGIYLPVGASREERSAFRVMATSRLDLESQAAAGQFQTELFYRICGVHLKVPPLAEEGDGLRPLIETLLEQIQQSDDATIELTEGALDALVEHPWPGNVRELKLTLRRLVALHAGQAVDAKLVAANLKAHAPSFGTHEQSAPPSPSADLSADLAKLERQRILSALESNDGNQTKAANALGVSRKVLMRRLDQYGIPRPRKGAKPSD